MSTLAAGANTPTCPRDGSPLVAHGARGARRCETCSGTWLPYAAAIAGIGPVRHDPGTARPVDARCPADGSALLAIRHRGVAVEACPACKGVWLAAGDDERLAASARGLPDKLAALGVGGASYPAAAPGHRVRRFLVACGFAFAAMSLVLFTAVGAAAWVPAASFDVSGFLYLLQNLGNLAGFFWALLLGGLAVGCWVKAATLAGR